MKARGETSVAAFQAEQALQPTPGIGSRPIERLVVGAADLGVSRGEVWLVNFDPTIGQDIKKTRPAVVVSSNSGSVRFAHEPVNRAHSARYPYYFRFSDSARFLPPDVTPLIASRSAEQYIRLLVLMETTESWETKGRT